MNKLILTGLLVIVLITGMYFAYRAMNTNPDQTPSSESTSEQTSNQAADTNTNASTGTRSGQTTSLAQLSRQGAQQCDITITPEGSAESYQGRFYTDGTGKFRSELESGPNGGVYYLIVADQMFYNWSNQNTQGIKREVKATTQEEYDAALNESDLSQTYDFNCSSWNVEMKMLTPPANITFTDMTNLPTNPYQ